MKRPSLNYKRLQTPLRDNLDFLNLIIRILRDAEPRVNAGVRARAPDEQPPPYAEEYPHPHALTPAARIRREEEEIAANSDRANAYARGFHPLGGLRYDPRGTQGRGGI